MIAAYLPDWQGLAVLAALLVVTAALAGVGGRLIGRDTPPELALVSGWGALCLLMTAWAVATSRPASIPLCLFGAAALLGRYRRVREAGRLAVLTLPLWAVLAAARPSQVDTWLNLLPNLAFLTDHASLPADGGPPSWSFLPAAPYNTQFVGYAVSWLSRGLAANALSLFNAVLLCAAGLHLARLCVPVRERGLAGRVPGWQACALGLLLAVPLNPGFVPRVFLASYGEAPIAVTLMFAVALGAGLFEAAQTGSAIRGPGVSLALVLCALVEIKQSALGLLVPFSAGLLLLGMAAPAMNRLRWCAVVVALTAPAVLLYLGYRYYVLSHFAAGELKMLPFAEWHLGLFPQILRGIAFAVFEKVTYFTAVFAVLVAAVVEARHRPWQPAAVTLALCAALVTGFNAFLLFTYVAHFPAIWAVNAHSYFRYMSQISLVVMLGLVTWLRPLAAAWLARVPGDRLRDLLRWWTGPAAVAFVILLPLAGIGLLRFDLDAPQPFLWELGHRVAALVRDDDRLALVLPGDGDDAVGSMLRGVLLFTEPRRPHLDFRSELSATPEALADARRAGFERAVVTCAPSGLAGLPPGTAGLLSYREGVWQVDATWPVPPGLARARFSAMLPRQPFCLTVHRSS